MVICMSEPEYSDAKEMSKRHAVLCVVHCMGAAAVALVWFQAMGLGDAALLPIRGTDHQVTELHAVQSAM